METSPHPGRTGRDPDLGPNIANSTPQTGKIVKVAFLNLFPGHFAVVSECSVYGILDTTFSPAEIPFFYFLAKNSRKNP